MPKQFLKNAGELSAKEGCWLFTTTPNYHQLDGTADTLCVLDAPKDCSASAINVTVFETPSAHALICITQRSGILVIMSDYTSVNSSWVANPISLKPGDELMLNVSLGNQDNPLLAGLLTFKMTDSSLTIIWRY